VSAADDNAAVADQTAELERLRAGLAEATALLERWYRGDWVGADTETFLLVQRKAARAPAQPALDLNSPEHQRARVAAGQPLILTREEMREQQPAEPEPSVTYDVALAQGRELHAIRHERDIAEAKLAAVAIIVNDYTVGAGDRVNAPHCMYEIQRLLRTPGETPSDGG